MNIVTQCPLPEPIQTRDEVLLDLSDLVEFLRNNERVGSRTMFSRGTLLPDGRLDLCKQSLGVAGAEQVFDALVENSQVRSLLLGTNGIGDPGAQKVAHLIQRNDRLEVIYLGCNAISDQGMAAIARSLQDNRTVTGLWLKRNPIGELGAFEIAGMLERNRTIRVLDLVHTGIRGEGLAAILEVLTKTNRSVQKLFLGGNQLSAIHGDGLADLLQENPAITGLFLNVNDLRDDGVVRLSRGLARNRSLIELGLGSNGLGAAGCRELMQAVALHPRLKYLDLGYSPSTRVLGAVGNDLGEQGPRSIALCLEQNSELQKLNLNRAGVDVVGARVIADALVKNQSLWDLILDGPLKAVVGLEALLQRNRLNTAGDRYQVSEDIALIRSVYR